MFARLTAWPSKTGRLDVTSSFKTDSFSAAPRNPFNHWAACLLVLVMVVAPAEGAAEPPEVSEPVEVSEPDGWDYVIPVASMLAVNTTFWATARYVLEADYAYIDLDSMSANFEAGFEWDADGFPINQIGHPYQGALYHGGARSVGLGFWASLPYTVLGSLQWELFMETEHPSYNDLITTTVGGIALGEVLFRLSSRLIDESSTGAPRVAREGGALVVNPIHGLSRLFSGAATRQGAGPVPHPVRIRLAAGMNRLRLGTPDAPGPPSLGLDARVLYGTLAETDEPFEPFDWFSLEMGLKVQESQLGAAHLDITGLLTRWSIGCGADNDCAWGLINHYDYYDSPIFNVGTSSLGAGLLADFQLPWSLELFLEGDLAAIALGGLDSPYPTGVERDYSLGAGGMLRATGILSKRHWGRIRLIHTRYYMRTVHGVRSHDVAGITRAELEVPIYGDFAVSAGTTLHDRLTVPEDNPRLRKGFMAGQLHLVWNLR